MEFETKNNRKYWLIAGLILVLFALNVILNNFYVSSWFNIILSGAILCFSFLQFRKRLALFFFTLSLNLFLIARPIIDILMDFSRYLTMHYSLESAHRANLMISVSLLGLIVGQILYENFLEERELSRVKEFPKIVSQPAIRWLSIGVGLISFYSLFLTIQEKIVFRQNNSYTSLYSDFSSNLPFVVQGFASIAVTMTILIAVTTKRKWIGYGALVIYLTLNGYLMKAGVRADFTKILLFVLFIFMQKDLLPRIRRKHIAPVILGGVLLFGLLAGVFHQIEQSRSDYVRKNDYILPVQLIYDQSISYMTLNRGQELKQMDFYKDKHYTFGPFLDQFGSARSIKPYTVEFVEKGDSLAADIAFHLYGENAFKGYGLGSSYIMELFSDYGYLGLGIFSILLGLLLGSLSRLSWKNFIVDAIKLRILMEIFYIPRAPATQFLVNLLVPQFFLPIIGSLIFGWFVFKIRHRRRA